MSEGYVYILSNPSMPGLVKIGRSKRWPEERAKQLHQTGVPTPFAVVDYQFSPNSQELERWVHDALSDHRVSDRREFFKCSIADASHKLEQCHFEQVSVLFSEYLPEHVLVEELMHIDEPDIGLLAMELRAHPFEVVEAFNMMTPDEFRPALERWKRKKSGKSE